MEALGNITVKGGDDRTYTLNFGVNAMCRLEELTGRPYHEVMREMQSGLPRMATIRQFLQAGLVDPRPESAEQVGTIIEDIGGAAVVLRAFGQSDAAIAAALAQEDAPPARRGGRKRR